MVLPLSFLVLYVNHQLYHYMYMHVLNKENSAEFMKHISLIQRDVRKNIPIQIKILHKPNRS